MAPGVRIEESDMSRRGQSFKTANGEMIANPGEQTLRFTIEEGKTGMTQYQICGDVYRPLMPVSQTCDHGNTVFFTRDGGYVYQLADGSVTRFERYNNTYELGMWVKSSDANGKPQGTGSEKDGAAYSALQAIQGVMRQTGFTWPGQ